MSNPLAPQTLPPAVAPATGTAAPAVRSVGAAIAGQPPVPTEQDQQGFSQKVQGFLGVFQKPEVQAALLQAGIRLMQPIPVGQTTLGQLGVAIGEGAGAAGRVQTLREKQAQQERQNVQRERQITVQERGAAVGERQATTGERQEERLADQGQQRIELERQQLEQTRGLKQQELGLRAQIAQETNDLERGKLIQRMSEVNRQIEAASDALTRQLAGRLEVAEASGEFGVLKGLLENSFLTGATSDQIIQQFNQIKQSVAGVTPEQRAALPQDVSTFSDEQWAQIFSNPTREMKLRLFFTQDPAQQAIIEQKKQEFVTKRQTKAPAVTPQTEVPAGPGVP